MDDNEEKTAKFMKYLAGYDPGDEVEPTFSYYSFTVWTRVILVGVVVGMFYVNIEVLDPSTYYAHFRTFVTTVIGFKAWEYVEDFADLGVKIGMIYEKEDEDLNINEGKPVGNQKQEGGN